MILKVQHPAGIANLTVEPGQNLAEALGGGGLHLDTRCGGRDICDRCRIHLLSGRFAVNGAETAVPAFVNSCRTTLLESGGVIAVPGTSLAPTGSAGVDFAVDHLPRLSEPVLAIDLGTTTVQAALVRDGRVVAANGVFNRQFRFGDNVASRIVAAADHLEELRRCAVESVLEAVEGFPGLSEVRRAVLAGNTVMASLWHGIDPAPIGVLPFTPPTRVFPELPGGIPGIPAPLLTVPAISGYVGGDLTAGLLTCPLEPGDMLIDIGTNCEIILETAKAVYCTAAAAGPAFEGAGVRSGSRPVPGAIDRITPDGGGLTCHTIGGLPPAGICGSAFVEFLAAARQTGLVNEFGRLAEFETEGTLRYYPLAPGVLITEADIEQILKAKGAVFAGIVSLLEHAGLTTGDLRRVYLAGGFARHLNLDAALAIGMLPPLPRGGYLAVGNTALGGAALTALNPELETEALRLIERPQEIALNTIPSFEFNYIDALLLP